MQNQPVNIAACGMVIQNGDSVDFQMIDPEEGTYYGIATVIDQRAGEVFISEPGNMGAEGWISPDLLRVRID